MVRIAICDDERVELERLEPLVREYCEAHDVIHEVSAFQSGEELLSAIHQGFDIVFLDVYMGGKDGLSVAHAIREVDSACKIIFATNSRAHAIDGYGVRALQYLLKPVQAENLSAALDLAMAELTKTEGKSVQIKNRQGSYRIPLDDLVYAESNARVVIIHTVAHGEIKYYEKLDNFESLCDDGRFLRCHKSFLVNLDFAVGIVNEKIVLESGESLPVSMSLSKAKAAFAAHTAKRL